MCGIKQLIHFMSEWERERERKNRAFQSPQLIVLLCVLVTVCEFNNSLSGRIQCTKTIHKIAMMYNKKKSLCFIYFNWSVVTHMPTSGQILCATAHICSFDGLNLSTSHINFISIQSSHKSWSRMTDGEIESVSCATVQT